MSAIRNPATITSVGRRMMTAGGDITYTKAVLYGQDISHLTREQLESLTSIGNPLVTVPLGISDKNDNGNGTTVILEATFQNSNLKADLPYTAVGFFAKRGDEAEKLVAVGVATDGAYLAATSPDGVATDALDIKVAIAIGDSANVTAMIDPAGSVTPAALHNAITDVKSEMKTGLDTKADKQTVTDDLVKKADKTDVDAQIGTVNKSVSDLSDTVKANKDDTDKVLATKADKATVESELSTKANQSDLDKTNSEVAKKADSEDVNAQLATKANSKDVNAALALKDGTADVDDKISNVTKSVSDLSATVTANKKATDSTLATKANASDVADSLATKANRTDVASDVKSLQDSIATKANQSDLAKTNATVATKANATALADYARTVDVNADLATKADKTDLDNYVTNDALKSNTKSLTDSIATKANSSDVADQLATKANQSDLDKTNATVATKADDSEVKNYAKSLQANIDTKANKSNVDSDIKTINDTLATKANSSDVNTALAGKANTTDLALLAKTADVNKQISDANNQEQADIRAIQKALATKREITDSYSRDELDKKFLELSAGTSGKVDADQVAKLIANKADDDYVDKKIKAVTDLANTKANTADVNSDVAKINQTLANKADNSAVTNNSQRIATLEGKKAVRSDFGNANDAQSWATQNNAVGIYDKQVFAGNKEFSIVPQWNLLTNSKGPFHPVNDPNGIDQWEEFENSRVDLIKGKVYTISAQTNGNFTDQDNGGVASNNCVLWLCDDHGINQIVSTTSTATGTTFTWNNPTGSYCLRVNRYGADSPVKAWNVKIEQGTVATDWIPAVSDLADQATLDVLTSTVNTKANSSDVDTKIKAVTDLANTKANDSDIYHRNTIDTAFQARDTNITNATNLAKQAQTTANTKANISDVNAQFSEIKNALNQLTPDANAPILPTNFDLDTVFTGWRRSVNTTLKNMPFGWLNDMMIFQGTVAGGDGRFELAFYIGDNANANPKVAYRFYGWSKWKPWVLLADNGDISNLQNQITNATNLANQASQKVDSTLANSFVRKQGMNANGDLVEIRGNATKQPNGGYDFDMYSSDWTASKLKDVLNALPGKASTTDVANANNNANGRLPLGGGNMTLRSTINWNGGGIDDKTGNLGGLQWAGGTDTVSIYGDQNNNDNLDLAFDLGDDSSNHFSFRNNGSEVAAIYSNGHFSGTVDWSNVSGRPDVNVAVPLFRKITAANTWNDILGASNNDTPVLVSIRDEGGVNTLGNFSSAVAFGGEDTKGVLNVAYSDHTARIIGGNGNAPVWHEDIAWKSDINSLNSTISALQQTVQSLQNTVNQQATQITGLQTQVNNQANEISYIKANYIEGKRFAKADESQATAWEKENSQRIAFITDN